MNLECFKYEVNDSVLLLTMNRPEVRNAWNWQMHDEYFEVLKQVNEDDSVRAIVLTGTPPAFSAGTDTKVLKSGQWRPSASVQRGDGQSTISLMHDLKKPVIAAINGAAIGMGLTITFMCDIRVASESAQMSMRFTQLGLIPEFASAYMLPRIIGQGRAMELCLTARTFGAQEALAMGLFTQVVPDDQIVPVALEIARGLAAKEPHAIRKTREMFYRDWDLSFAQALSYEPEEFAHAVQQTYGNQPRY